MSFTTSILCDHPHCDNRDDLEDGYVEEPKNAPGWACIYIGPSLNQHHLCPDHVQAALRVQAEGVAV